MEIRASSALKPRWTLSTGALVLMATVGIALIGIDIVLAFTVAPLVKGATLSAPVTLGEVSVTHKLLLSQKIFYLHVPVAISSFVMMGVMAFHGVRYIQTGQMRHDYASHSAAYVALFLVAATMASGILWTRFEWGVWWVWEPRLTTYAILTLMLLAYMVLRTSIAETHKQASFCAVFSILAFVNAPISFAITRLVPTSIHPVVLRSNAPVPPAMLIPVMLGLLGVICVSYVLYRLVRSSVSAKAHLDRLALSLEREHDPASPSLPQ